jgi:hypothetical protein
MVKSRSHHSLVKDNRHISYTTFRNSLKSDLDAVVEDPNMYSSHFLRAGGATKAVNSVLNDRLIQRHGHWKSVSSKNMYIDDSTINKLEVSKSIQK